MTQINVISAKMDTLWMKMEYASHNVHKHLYQLVNAIQKHKSQKMDNV